MSVCDVRERWLHTLHPWLLLLVQDEKAAGDRKRLTFPQRVDFILR